MDRCSEQKLSGCSSLLYADSVESVGGQQQPILSPRPIVDAVLQLEALLNKLEQVVANIVKDIDNKKSVNTSHSCTISISVSGFLPKVV